MTLQRPKSDVERSEDTAWQRKNDKPIQDWYPRI